MLTLYPPLLDVAVDLAGVAGVAEVGQPEGRQPVSWQTLIVPYTQPPPQAGAGGEETIMTLIRATDRRAITESHAKKTSTDFIASIYTCIAFTMSLRVH